MNLQQSLQNYLQMRRSLGFKLHSDGLALHSFVSFMADHQQKIITIPWALEWAKNSIKPNSVRWARRLSVVRPFARYCRTVEPHSEVIPKDLLPIHYKRPEPYIFSDIDIRRLLQASEQVSIKEPFFSHTLYCLFGLLSITGLRINEALNLTVDDIDFEEELLIVHGAKFGKSRLIPLHNTTIEILADYYEQRKAFLNGQLLSYWFVNRQKKRLGYDCVKYHFNHLLKSLEIYSQRENHKPHLQDLRHFFAVSVILKWYHNNEDVERLLPVLSAYLGHVETRDTYWYLSACPELMNCAKERLEQYWEKRS
jgi:integrase/recombinase XerD